MIDFQAPYDRNTYLQWFQAGFLPDDFVAAIETTSISFSTKYIRKALLLGRSVSIDLLIYEVHHESENDPRVSLAKETFHLLAEYLVRNALVIYISNNSKNYRLSYISIDLKILDGKIQKEFSNPRRYSFFLGPNCKTHTPMQFLIKRGRIKNLDDLQERFSVEVVNKEFYNEIAILFTKLVGGSRKIGSKTIDEKGLLRLPSLPNTEQNHQKYQEFAVRLIGRLVFCWFLKKKSSASGIPLISEDILSSQAVRENEHYYHNILEYLFFQVLNTPQDERTEIVQDRFKDTPFLNGGLFEPHEDDYYDPDLVMGITRYLNNLNIIDGWFLDLFTVFETYNFTIDENTSIDIELSIDPEMLGRIFENLLAEINPETGETARKATGSFYTPRPIVEYMIDESLRQYLKKKTGIDTTTINKILSYSDEVEISKLNRSKIIQAIDEIKILDPACGSGAFPIGMLQKLLLILQKIDPDAKEWQERTLKSIPDPVFRKIVAKKLESDQDLWDYSRKLGIIRKSIYGVDLQAIAIEISKLRVFLSLIVDEKVEDDKSNRGIEHLPNLEFKFVAANTLICLPAGQSISVGESEDKIIQLKRLRENYFISHGLQKKEIEDSFIKKQQEMAEDLNNWIAADSMTFKLISWEPFTYNSADFFDPQWMFGVKNGFDIVIGNPPYLESRHPSFSNELKILYQKSCENRWNQDAQFITRGADLLVYFLEASISFINSSGIIVLITQNAWLDTEYGIKAQKFLINHTNVISIIDSQYRYFPSGEGPNINTIISVFTGNAPTISNKITFMTLKDSIDRIFFNEIDQPSNGNDQYSSISFAYSDGLISKYKWGILQKSDSFVLRILKTLEEKAMPLNKITLPGNKFYYGQGLNLLKSYYIPIEIIKKYNIPPEHCIPILYSGSPYLLISSDWYLVKKSKISKKTANYLMNEGFVLFDENSTRKKPPLLILPRGISRHYCSINNINAHSLSGVDVYAFDDKNIENIIVSLWLFFNSSIFWLLREISGRKNLGGGLLKSEAADLEQFPVYMKLNMSMADIPESFNRDTYDTLSEIYTEEHKQIDNLIFTHLSMTKEDQLQCIDYLIKSIEFRDLRSKT